MMAFVVGVSFRALSQSLLGPPVWSTAFRNAVGTIEGICSLFSRKWKIALGGPAFAGRFCF
jgi:hypothetical protein